MMALKERLPETIIVPAHNMRAFARTPKLFQSSIETSNMFKTVSMNKC
jgi:hypothetical protein